MRFLPKHEDVFAAVIGLHDGSVLATAPAERSRDAVPQIFELPPALRTPSAHRLVPVAHNEVQTSS